MGRSEVAHMPTPDATTPPATERGLARAPRGQVGHLIDDYLTGLQAAKRSAHTIAGYRNDLDGIARHVATWRYGAGAAVAKLAVQELAEPAAIRAGFAAWADNHGEGAMVRAWGVWDRFYRHLIACDILARSPMGTVPKAKLEVPEPRAIRTPDLAGTLLRTAATADPAAQKAKRWPERDVALVGLFCVSGIRLQEAINAQLRSVTGPPGERVLQVHGKGKRQRSLPIAPGMDSLLEDYLASRAARHGAAVLRVRGNPLLVHYDGSALTRGRIQYVIERLYERAAIRGAVPPGALVHALRHSFATLAIGHGTNVAELQRLMGHATLATTGLYLSASNARTREAIGAHPSQHAVDAVVQAQATSEGS